MTTREEMTENPRGYAFTALDRGYQRANQWDWGIAASMAGYMPDKYTYIQDGLAMFDTATAVSTEHYKDIIFTIVKEMNSSINNLAKGEMGYPTVEGVQVIRRKYDTTLDVVVRTDPRSGVETTLGDLVPETEEGYGTLDDADVMRARLRAIALKITPHDYDILVAFVSGEAPDIKAAAGGKTEAYMWTKRVRGALAQFIDLDLFMPVA